MPNKLELMELQVKALFTHDNNNCIRSINELNGAVAPKFFYGRTPEGNVLRFRYDLPEDVIRKLKNLVSTEPVHSNLPRTSILLEEIKKIIGEHSEIHEIEEGPAYKLPKRVISSSDVIKITRDNVNTLKDSFAYMLSELQFLEPCFVKFVNGNAVSICFSARISDKSHEVGVETLPNFRGKGYAAEVVSAWADAIYEMGRIPSYSTSWENTASLSVARKMKCELYGVDLSVF